MISAIKMIAILALSLVVGTIGGALITWTAAGLILYAFMDASWQWAVGIGVYGAIPGATVGWIAGMFFGLFKIELAGPIRANSEQSRFKAPRETD